jgi:superoxide oxidase
MTSPAKHAKQPVGFSKISMSLHWLMLLLIVAVYATVEMKGLSPTGGDLRQALKPLHLGLGIAILILVTVRIAYNAFHITPPIVPTPPVWRHLSGKLTHYLLYFSTIAALFHHYLIRDNTLIRMLPSFGSRK